MPTFNDINSLKKYIEKQVSATMSKEVSNAIRKEMKYSIEKNVYSKNPEAYIRRGDDGGFKDIDNIIGTMVSDTELVVENITNPNPITDYEGNYYNNAFKYPLDSLIENGTNPPLLFNEERPFIDDAINSAKSNNSHVEAMKDGLKKLGLDVI